MCIANRALSLVYKLIIVIASGIGILFTAGLPQGTFDVQVFRYFTVISNLLVFVFFLISCFVVLYRMAKNGVHGTVPLLSSLKGAITMSIIITMLVYQFLLRDTHFSMGITGSLLANELLHLVVPLLVVGDYILFDRKGRMLLGDPAIWLIIPLLYFGYVLLCVQLDIPFSGGAAYPYEFIDAEKLGWSGALTNVALFAVIFLALGYIIFGLDRILGTAAKKKAERERRRLRYAEIAAAGYMVEPTGGVDSAAAVKPEPFVWRKGTNMQPVAPEAAPQEQDIQQQPQPGIAEAPVEAVNEEPDNNIQNTSNNPDVTTAEIAAPEDKEDNYTLAAEPLPDGGLMSDIYDAPWPPQDGKQ